MSIQTTCPYCGVGCGVLAEGLPGRLESVRGDPTHPANFGRLCVKGAALAQTGGLEGRLLHPHVNGRRTGWDEALQAVAEGFSAAIREHGPESVAFYVSGQLLTEDYYVANKLMKGWIGSANIDTNSRLCMASAVAGYKRAFGADAVPCCYEDLETADLILLIGSNTAWAHPVVYQRIQAAKAARPSLQVVVIDPRRTASCDLADLHLALQPGSDTALLVGLLGWLEAHGHLDEAVWRAHDGAEEALQVARGWPLERVAEACGLRMAEVLDLYTRFAQTPRTVALYSQGLNQSSSGVDKSNAVINCFLATGRIGRPGMGPFSITGQPNAMGGREVGGLASQLAAHMDFSAEDRQRVQSFWKSPTLAERPGLKAVDLFQAMGEGRIKAVWIMATNPVVSMPDADAVRAALGRCDLVVVSDIVAETDTIAHAHIRLPALGWGEKDGTVTNSERCISRQRAVLDAPGEARPDWWMVCEVARRMGAHQGFELESPAAIFREHAALSAFENDGRRAFDIGGLACLSDSEYEALEPIQWPVPTVGHPGTPRLFSDGRYFTPSGRARMVAVCPRSPESEPSSLHPYRLNTGRLRDQWHTMTRTARAPRLLAHRDEPFVEVSPVDAQQQGLMGGDLVRLTSPTGWMLARVEVSAGQQPGSLFVPMHWTAQLSSQGRMGPLVAAVVDPISGQPESKHAVVAMACWPSAWQAVLFSRTSPVLDGIPYWVRVPLRGGQRLELAGQTTPVGLRAWAVTWLGLGEPDLEWISPEQGLLHLAWTDASGRLLAALYLAQERVDIDRQGIGPLLDPDRPPLTTEDRRLLLLGRPSMGGADSGPLICSCFAVGERVIRDAIAEGCRDAASLGRRLSCGTNCGSCIPELNGLIRSVATASPTTSHLHEAAALCIQHEGV